ncbi:MAG: ankyrin repeat domain-containing protein [Candidatus Bilamarchaeaceae archaeon]
MREISKNEGGGIPTQQTENKRMHLKEPLVKSKISLKKSLGFKAKLKRAVAASGAATVMLTSSCGPGDTPLISAAKTGNTETVRTLIKAGTNVNAVNKYGNTALMYATENGHPEIAEILKQHE